MRYLVGRDTYSGHLYYQRTGYWKPDGKSMEMMAPATAKAELGARGGSGLASGRVWGVAGVVALLAGAYASGVFEVFRDIETARATLASWGTGAYVLYFVAFSLLEPFGVPALMFIIPASLIWGPWIALGLSLPGGVCAGILGFAFARYLARDWVASRLPAHLRRFNDRIEKNAFATVVLVRVTFFMFPPAHWFLGLSSVRFKPFVLGTAVGLVPGLLSAAFLGGGIAQWLVRQPYWVWALLAAALAVAVVVRRRLRGHTKAGRPS